MQGSTFKLVASGSVTLENIRLSGVNGNGTASGGAFVDFSAATVLTGKIGHLLEIYDSSNRKISGWIKAAGTGATYASNLVLNPEFDSDTTSWSAVLATLASITGGQSGNCLAVTLTSGSTGGAKQTVTVSSDGLYLYSSYYKKSTSTLGRVYLGSADAGSQYYTSGDVGNAAWTQLSKYFTSSGTSVFVYVQNRGGVPSIFLHDTVSLVRVLTPSATGVTITSTKGGGTSPLYNWAFKDSNFNWNSSYTYKIYKSTTAPVVASGTITRNNCRFHFVTGSAVLELSGVSLANYQGKHIAAIYDPNGVGAFSYTSSTAPGGETLGAEIATGTLTVNTLYKITATEASHFYASCVVGEYFTSDGTETCDANNKVKEVTDVAVTGALITNSLTGATRNWVYIGSGFAVKNTGTYSYKITHVGD